MAKKVSPKRSTTKTTQLDWKHRMKLFRLPSPQSLVTPDNLRAELRIALSYLPEPNMYHRRELNGLDLKWDMQGPAESDLEFLKRIGRPGATLLRGHAGRRNLSA